MEVNGREPQSPSEPVWTPRATLALTVLVLGATVSLIWLVHPLFDITTDGSIYILTAQSLLEGNGYTYLGEPFIVRPPGFSVLLIPVLGVFGTNFYALNLYVGLFGVLLVSTVFLYARPRVGVPVAFAIAAALWLNPSLQRLSTQVMSDVPGSAFMLLCLIVEPWARRNPSPRRDAILGVCIAAASYVRMINILLVPAILIARYLHGRSRGDLPSLGSFLTRHAAIVALVPLITVGAWTVRSAIHHPTPPVYQTKDYSYWVAMWHTDRGDPSSPTVTLREVAERVPDRLGEIVPLLGSRMRSEEPLLPEIAFGTTLLLCWLIAVVRRRSAGDLLAGATLALLAIYFALLGRLVLPLYVLVIVAAADTALWALGKRVRARIAEAIVVGLLALIAFLDFDPRAEWKPIGRRHNQYSRVAEHITAEFPSDAPVAALVGAPFSVYLKRPVYSLRPALKRDREGGFEEALRRHDIEVVTIERRENRDSSIIAHMSRFHGVEKRFGRLYVFRIDGPPK